MQQIFQYIILPFLIIFNNLEVKDDWPDWRGPSRDGTWNETGIVKKFDSNQIKILWKVPVSAGYSGPTVSDQRVFLTDRITQPENIERVLCFDAKTGEKNLVLRLRLRIYWNWLSGRPTSFSHY